MIEINENCAKCRNLQAVLSDKIDEINKLNSIINSFTQNVTLKSEGNQSVEFTTPLQKEAATQTNLNDTLFLDADHNTDTKKEVDKNEICDSAKNIVEQDYVFDENLKIYYSPSTGYYYDQNSGLLYEPHSQTYYKYDYSKGTYESVHWSNHENSTDTDVKDVVNQDFRWIDLTFLHTSDRIHSKKIYSGMITKVADCEFSYSNSHNETKEDLEQTCKMLCNANDGSSNECTLDWQTKADTGVTVADLVKDVVNEHYGTSDYTYDEKIKMYYSASTGYFFDAESELLCDPYTGTYYKYDSEKNSYEVHSVTHKDETNDLTIQSASTNVKIEKKKRKSRKKCIKESQNDSATEDKNYSSLEEGEILSSSSDCSDSDAPSSVSNISHAYYNPSGVWPPCIRAIVEESSKLKIGSLLMMTCLGGILGRDKSNAVYIPDISVSKAHAKISCDNESWEYSILDLGSQNGTFVNENRLSEPKEQSQPHTLKHGDKLCLGSFKLLLHIHDGMETCDQCEPGQILAEQESKKDKEIYLIKTKKEKEKGYRQELQRIKKKYGLERKQYEEAANPSIATPSGYEDKAALRRQTVGSQNPYEKDGESASLDKTLSSSNKGYQLLKKMGWSEGQSLGAADSKGILEPVPFRSWRSRAGLGAVAPLEPPRVPPNPRNRKWIAAQERYFKLS